MKIRCDVCEKAEASVFCSADEAALCETCDGRIHRANKLASKHLRFSLIHPSFKDSPLCDICQERRAFLFCQEDRAILCRECDIPIHKANEHTQKHNRFLLTGVKLSASSSASSNPTPASSINSNSNAKTANRNSLSHLKKPASSLVSSKAFSSPSVDRTVSVSPSMTYSMDDNCSASTSSISKYLETVPGWQVDEFLDPSAFANNGFWVHRLM